MIIISQCYTALGQLLLDCADCDNPALNQFVIAEYRSRKALHRAMANRTGRSMRSLDAAWNKRFCYTWATMWTDTTPG